ncbi:site-specific integrase [uncultured Campylobacter sp.]|uniref:tyrosine-type recombinase/integrase n=1 Tax=uncultured Campylobacter sp. TaxID=218934 RepID=UPI002610F735|nr:site-specific integrase [uncultured Campylobacter sp.]
MANIAKTYLNDKDIRSLTQKERKYFRVVGNPKELCIFINPKGTKVFSLRIRHNEKSYFYKIKEFREGIYSVAEARKDAIKLLKELEGGNDIQALKNANEKYKFKNLFALFMQQKRKKGLSDSYTKKVIQMHEKYLLPSLAEFDVKNIKYSDLLVILNAIYNPNNPRTSRLETIHRLINHLQGVFKIAIKDRYLDFDPSFGLKDEFPSPARFKVLHSIDTRYPALTQKEDLQDFIKDLKNDNKMELQTKRAIYLQILSVNRPFNTASAKWTDIDFENRIWTIPANEMKTRTAHEIPLSETMIQILKEQFLFSGNISKFVFPAFNTLGHIHRDSIGKAIRNLGAKNKYKEKASSHGFRATFRTICSQNKGELLKLGISEEVIESVLAHKELNQIKFSYERQKATIEQKRELLQWYENYLNNLENLGIIQ